MTRSAVSCLVRFFAALCLVVAVGTGCEEKKKDDSDEEKEGEAGEEGEAEGESGAGEESSDEGATEEGMEPPPIEADREVEGLELEVIRSQRIDRGEPQIFYSLLLVGDVPASSVAYGHLRPDVSDGANYKALPFNDPTARMKLRNREFPGTRDKGIKLDYTVTGVPDDAKTLAKLGGNILMAVPGQTEEIMIETPLEKVGGKLEHPKLTEAGIEVTLEETDGKRPGFSVAQTGGELGALENVELYLEEGKTARTSTSTDKAKPLPIFKISLADEEVALDSVKLGLKINWDFEIVKGTFAAENVEVP